jgi:DNA-binding NtrC family response regulator
MVISFQEDYMRQLRTERGRGSQAVREIIEEIKRASESDARVLISGDTGVRKEAIARRIHDQGARRSSPFVAMSCAGVSGDDLGSLFFARLERASGGTLFIDEIGELDSRLQEGLLTFLETGKLDVRIIAASSRSLHDKVIAGRFNASLFYRLNIIHIIGQERRRRDRKVRRFGQFQRRFRVELGAPS